MTAYTFQMVDHECEHGLELYFEDQYVALNTWDRKRAPGDHEILLDVQTVDMLIATLQAMKTDITARYPQKELSK
jgi:phage tail sheath gpL-like